MMELYATMYCYEPTTSLYQCYEIRRTAQHLLVHWLVAITEVIHKVGIMTTNVLLRSFRVFYRPSKCGYRSPNVGRRVLKNGSALVFPVMALSATISNMSMCQPYRSQFSFKLNRPNAVDTGRLIYIVYNIRFVSVLSPVELVTLCSVLTTGS